VDHRDPIMKDREHRLRAAVEALKDRTPPGEKPSDAVVPAWDGKGGLTCPRCRRTCVTPIAWNPWNSLDEKMVLVSGKCNNCPMRLRACSLVTEELARPTTLSVPDDLSTPRKPRKRRGGTTEAHPIEVISPRKHRWVRPLRRPPRRVHWPSLFWRRAESSYADNDLLCHDCQGRGCRLSREDIRTPSRGRACPACRGSGPAVRHTKCPTTVAGMLGRMSQGTWWSRQVRYARAAIRSWPSGADPIPSHAGTHRRSPSTGKPVVFSQTTPGT